MHGTGSQNALEQKVSLGSPVLLLDLDAHQVLADVLEPLALVVQAVVLVLAGALVGAEGVGALGVRHHVEAVGNVDLAQARRGGRARLDLVEAVVALGAVDAAVLGGDADAPPLVVGIVLVALALEGALVVLARGVLVAVVDLLDALVDVHTGELDGLADALRRPARRAHGARRAHDAVAVVLVLAGALVGA